MKSLKYDYYQIAKTQTIQGYNNTVSTIPIIKVVTASGHNSSLDLIEIEQVNDATLIPFGVTVESVSSTNRTELLRVGSITGIDTSGSVVGDPIYFDNLGDITLSGSVKIGKVLEVGVSGVVLIDLGGSGSSGGGSSFKVTQVNTFTKGQPVYYDGADWQLADTSEIAKVGVAVISETGNPFTASLSGIIELDGTQITALIGSATFTPGTTYYVADTPGLLTSLSPAISNPILKAISTTKALIQPGFVASSNGVGESIVEDTFLVITPTDNLTLSSAPLGKSYVWVSLDGFVEEPDAFTIANNVITFTYTIPASTKVVIKYVKTFKLDTRNNIIPFYEQVSGSPKSAFNLPVQPENSNYVLVWVDSVFQFNSFSLVGNVLTFDTPISIGQEVVIRIIQAVNFDIDVNNYITRKVVDIANDGDVLISIVFGDNLSGEYRIKIQDNPRIWCHAWLHVGNDADFFTISSDVTNTFGTASKLNIDYNSNTIRIQNRTGSSRSVVIVREL